MTYPPLVSLFSSKDFWENVLIALLIRDSKMNIEKWACFVRTVFWVKAQ